MNENQMNFLDELAALLDKYNVGEVYVGYDKTRIVFNSNGSNLCFMTYASNEFHGVSTAVDTYNAKITDKKAEPVTNPLTIEGVKEILDINKNQREVLQDITEDIDDYINMWGENGRLIDRDTVIKSLKCIKENAVGALEKSGKNENNS